MTSKTPESVDCKFSPEQQQAKISEIRDSLGQLPENLSIYCSDAAIVRYLKARNWDVKKAKKMLKDTLKWRLKYKPEKIQWEDIAVEAETGKIYRSDFVDKNGRSVLVMRPSCQNTKSTTGQIKYLVYCMENAILNLPPDQEQMVWLIDFHGFQLQHVSIKSTRETAHVLQNHYPERLGVAILYNPPKFFEPFWMMAKPFLEPKTCAKVKFVYSDDPGSMKIMDGLFDMDKLEHTFGGNNQVGFDFHHFAEKMKEDDRRMSMFWTRGSNTGSSEVEAAVSSTFLNSEDYDESCRARKQEFSVDLNSENSLKSPVKKNGWQDCATSEGNECKVGSSDV